MQVLKNLYSRWIEDYGTEEDKIGLRNRCLKPMILIFLMIIFVNPWLKFIHWFYVYMCLIEGVMLIGSIVTYFYKKRERAHKFKTIKKISYIGIMGSWMILFSPIIIVVAIKNVVGKNINYNYIIKRNFECFCVEIMWHFIIVITLIKLVIELPPNKNEMLLLCIVCWIVDWLFVTGTRKFLLLRKNYYYEKYIEELSSECGV